MARHRQTKKQNGKSLMLENSQLMAVAILVLVCSATQRTPIVWLFWSTFNYLSFVSFSKCFMKLSLAVWWSTMVTLWLWYECKTAIFTSTSVLSFHSDVGVRVSRSNFWAIFYVNKTKAVAIASVWVQLKSMDSENVTQQRKYKQMGPLDRSAQL